MEDVLSFIREYSQIYKIERYVALAVSIITLLVLLTFFGYQIFSHKDAPIEKSTEIINAFVGLGSTGIISVSIGYIFKFMDKAMDAAREFISNRQNN